MGGLALPEFKGYYRAAQLRVLPDWSAREFEKIWLHMDRALAGLASLDLVWLPKSDRRPNVYLGTPTGRTLRVWDVLSHSRNLPTFPSPHTLIHFNPSFTPRHVTCPFKTGTPVIA